MSSIALIFSLLAFQNGAPALQKLASWGNAPFTDVATMDKGNVLALAGMELFVIHPGDTEEPSLNHRIPLRERGQQLATHNSMILVSGETVQVLFIDDQNQYRFSSTIRPPKGEYVLTMAVSDTFAAILTYEERLHIYKIDQGTNFLGHVYSMDVPYGADLAVNGQYLYVAGLKFHAMDLTDIANPIIETQEWQRAAIHVHGDYLYAAGTASMESHSLADPMNPVQTGHVSLFINTAYDLAVKDNYLIIDAHPKTIYVDITDPTTMIPFLGNGALRGQNMAVGGDWLFQSDGSDLKTWDLSDMSDWQPVATPSYGGTAYRFVRRGSFGYVAHGAGGLRMLDLANLQQIRQTDRIDRYTTDVMVLAGGVWAAHHNLGLALYTPDVAGTLTLKAAYGARPVNTLTVHGNYLVTAGDGLHIFNTLSESLEPVGSLYQPGLVEAAENSVTVIGNKAYVSHPFVGVQIYDIADPTNIIYLGATKAGRTLNGAIRHDDLLLVAGKGQGLLSLHPGDSADMKTIGFGPNALETHGLAISDKTAWLCDDLGLRFYDVTIPTHPRDLGRHNIHGGVCVVNFNGNRAYVAGNHGVVHVFDRNAASTYQSVIPWVVHNPGFESRVSIYNPNPTTATVTLNGVARVASASKVVNIPGNGRFTVEAADLFPTLDRYALHIEANKPLLPRFFIANSEGAPSQARGQVVSALSNELLFSYLPTDQIGAIVLNTPTQKGLTSTTIVIDVFDETGQVVRQYADVLGRTPHVIPVYKMYNNLKGAVTLRIHTPEGTPLAGTSFVFDQNNNPSMSEAFIPGAPL